MAYLPFPWSDHMFTAILLSTFPTTLPQWMNLFSDVTLGYGKATCEDLERWVSCDREHVTFIFLIWRMAQGGVLIKEKKGDKYKKRSRMAKQQWGCMKNIMRNHIIKYLLKINYNTGKSVYKYTYTVHMKFLIFPDSASSMSQRLPNKTPNTKYEMPSSELLVTVVQ